MSVRPVGTTKKLNEKVRLTVVYSDEDNRKAASRLLARKIIRRIYKKELLK